MTPAKFVADSVRGARIAWSKAPRGKQKQLAFETYALCVQGAIIVLRLSSDDCISKLKSP